MRACFLPLWSISWRTVHPPWKRNHGSFVLPRKKKNCHYILNDFWKDLPAESYLYSSAFSGDYQSETTIKVTASADGSITFRALCPCLHHKRQVLAISGDCPALGNWDIQKTVLMEEIQPNEWTITLNVSTLEFPLSYKFVACNADSKQVEEWENHDNRMLNNPELKKEKFTWHRKLKFISLHRPVRWREQLSLYFLSAVRKVLE